MPRWEGKGRGLPPSPSRPCRVCPRSLSPVPNRRAAPCFAEATTPDQVTTGSIHFYIQSTGGRKKNSKFKKGAIWHTTASAMAIFESLLTRLSLIELPHQHVDLSSYRLTAQLSSLRAPCIRETYSRWVLAHGGPPRAARIRYSFFSKNTARILHFHSAAYTYTSTHQMQCKLAELHFRSYTSISQSLRLIG
jgi:hypothetical protein